MPLFKRLVLLILMLLAQWSTAAVLPVHACDPDSTRAVSACHSGQAQHASASLGKAACPEMQSAPQDSEPLAGGDASCSQCSDCPLSVMALPSRAPCVSETAPQPSYLAVCADRPHALYLPPLPPPRAV